MCCELPQDMVNDVQPSIHGPKTEKEKKEKRKQNSL